MSAIDTTPDFVNASRTRSSSTTSPSFAADSARPLTYARERSFSATSTTPRTRSSSPARATWRRAPTAWRCRTATAQMALLQFMLAGRETTAVPTTVHCDHLIRAHVGAESDMRAAKVTNREVYEFLSSACGALRHRFLGAGRGHHPPGGARELRLPRWHDDRHRLAHAQRGRPGHVRGCGVGGADAVDVMAGIFHGKCSTRTRSGFTSRVSSRAGRRPRTSSSRCARPSPSRAAPTA